MKEEDLWIGDKVRLKKSGRIGKYEGKNKQGKHRVNLGHKSVITSLQNLELIEYDSPAPKKTKVVNVSTISPIEKYSGKSIDLHIEILKPKLVNSTAFQILAYQLKEAKQFLEYATHHKLKVVTIIHGKGEGVLKTEVHHLLKMEENIHSYFTINNGGATEIWLK